MTYERQIWQDLPSKETPLTAARLNHMELGIESAQATRYVGPTDDRDAATATLGERWFDTNESVEYYYTGSAWAYASQPITAFVRSASNLSTGATLSALDFSNTPLSGAAFTESSGVFTCAIDGTYLVTYSVTYASGSATGVRRAALVPSSGVTHSLSSESVPSAIAISVPVIALFTLTAGQTVTAQAAQSSGGNLSTSASITFMRVS